MPYNTVLKESALADDINVKIVGVHEHSEWAFAAPEVRSVCIAISFTGEEEGPLNPLRIHAREQDRVAAETFGKHSGDFSNTQKIDIISMAISTLDRINSPAALSATTKLKQVKDEIQGNGLAYTHIGRILGAA